MDFKQINEEIQLIEQEWKEGGEDIQGKELQREAKEGNKEACKFNQ